MQQDDKQVRQEISNNTFGAMLTLFAQYDESNKDELHEKLIEAESAFLTAGYTSSVAGNLIYVLQKIDPIKYYFLHSQIGFYLTQIPVLLGLKRLEKPNI